MRQAGAGATAVAAAGTGAAAAVGQLEPALQLGQEAEHGRLVGGHDQHRLARDQALEMLQRGQQRALAAQQRGRVHRRVLPVQQAQVARLHAQRPEQRRAGDLRAAARRCRPRPGLLPPTAASSHAQRAQYPDAGRPAVTARHYG